MADIKPCSGMDCKKSVQTVGSNYWGLRNGKVFCSKQCMQSTSISAADLNPKDITKEPQQ